jgi:phage-related protein
MASKRDNIERKDDTTTSQQQWQQRERVEQQHHAINRALDETKDNIRKTTDEARNQIPRYTQAVNDYQEQTIQAIREIADNYLDSQREIINSFQTAWVPQIENANRAFWPNGISPRHMTELYANMVSSFVNNMIAATRLTNNMIFANMDAFKTSLQQAKDNTKELSRIGVNTAKSFEQTSRDSITRRGGSTGYDTTTSRVSVETEEGQGQDRARRRF